MIEALPPISSGELDLALLKQLLGTDAPLILEIGANDGTDTVRFLRAFPDATVRAFEPDPRAVTKFKARGYHPRLHLFEIAIGADDGEAGFYASSGLPSDMSLDVRNNYPLGWDQSGSLKAPKNHKAVWPWVKFERKFKVAVKRLDTWAKDRGVTAVDFIWADIQGAEGDLIVGGMDTLANTHYLYTEYSNDEWYEGQPNLAKLESMLPTFSILRRYPMNVLFENRAFNSITSRSSRSHIFDRGLESAELVHYQNTRRNELCPCGSGKRHKHCHGRLA